MPVVTRDAAKRLVEEEFAKSGVEVQEHMGDIACFDEIIGVPRAGHRPIDYGALLHALCYRGQQQLVVWDIFIDLCKEGFLDPSGVFLPINFNENPDAVRRVGWRLSCFEYPQEESDVDPLEKPYRL